MPQANGYPGLRHAHHTVPARPAPDGEHVITAMLKGGGERLHETYPSWRPAADETYRLNTRAHDWDTSVLFYHVRAASEWAEIQALAEGQEVA